MSENIYKEDWVECKFGDLLNYEQPTKYIVESTAYHDSYKTPVLTAGKTFILGYTNEVDGIFDNLPTIIFDDFTTASKYVNFKFKVKSSAMKILTPTSSLVNLKFVFYAMQVNQVRSDTHKRYWISVFAKKKFLLAPLPIQRAIVKKIEELFSSLDSGIADLQKTQEQLKIYRQAVLKKAFEGELTDISLEITLLSELIHSVEYGSSKKSDDMGEVPVLRMGNLQNGLIDWRDLKYTSDKEEIEKYKLRKNDVLFNRTNSPELVGKTSIFLSDKQAIFAGYLIRINYKQDRITGKYLNYYLNSITAKIHGNDVKTDGVNQSNINGTKLKKYPIPICSIPEQNEIVKEIESRLSVCDAVEKTIAESLQKAESLRQSILKQAFDGKLLSPDEINHCKQQPDYEPATNLLKRTENS